MLQIQTTFPKHHLWQVWCLQIFLPPANHHHHHHTLRERERMWGSEWVCITVRCRGRWDRKACETRFPNHGCEVRAVPPAEARLRRPSDPSRRSPPPPPSPFRLPPIPPVYITFSSVLRRTTTTLCQKFTEGFILLRLVRLCSSSYQNWALGLLAMSWATITFSWGVGLNSDLLTRLV